MQLTPKASSPPSPPHLEYFKDGSDKPQRLTIEHSTFKIGRCETCDLQIDSAEVSREHAQIFRRGNIWMIRDLGSTNGTQVNGRPVRESFLSDGDILAIAETKVTFVASSVSPFQRMATQPIQPRQSSKLPALLPSEITQMRALVEATLWQAIPLRLEKVVSFSNGKDEAWFAHCIEKTNPNDPEFNALHVVGRHYRELFWRRAIETAQAQRIATPIFLAADGVDFESPRDLLADIERLRDTSPHDFELGVAISLTRVLDHNALANICREIRKTKLLLGFVSFQGSGGQVLELASCAPDYLILSDTMLRGVISSSQPLRRMELALATCEHLGIKAVLPQCTCQRTIAQCRQVGYEFALQPMTPDVEDVHQTGGCSDQRAPRLQLTGLGLE